jgi:LVIVD repeat
MNKWVRVSTVVVAIVASLGLSLSTSSIVLGDGSGVGDKHGPVPWTGPVPKADCGRGDHTESGLQGQTTPAERSSGDSKRAYNCNLELVGQFLGEGAVSQDGPAYTDECAYYATNNNPTQQHHGVVVVDASDPRHPRVSKYLDDTVTMLDPHETLKLNERRKLLAGAQSNGPGFALYDVAADCRYPILKSNIQLTNSLAHAGNFDPDGLTYYVTQSNRGIGGILPIVDVSNPSNPKQLLNWQFPGNGRPHDLSLNDHGFAPGLPEGTRLYGGQPGLFGNTGSSIGPNGLVILDVSDIKFRHPNPQIRLVSTLFWNDGGQAEQAQAVTILGKPHVITSDESGGAGGVGGLAAACARGASPFGFPQIIDITDERNPKIIAKLMLEVNDPANCLKLVNDPPDQGAGTPAYNDERCQVDRANNPKMLACAFQNAGLRIFDIRDPYHPIEIAYYKPPAPRTAVLPGSGSWAPGVDLTVDRVAGYARFHKANRRFDDKHGSDLEIWTVSDGNGFQVVRFTDDFKTRHEDLFEDSEERNRLSGR